MMENDREKIDQLISEGLDLPAPSPRGFELFQEALGMAISLEEKGEPYDLGRANAETYVARGYSVRGDYQKSIRIAQDAIKRFEKVEDKTNLVEALIVLAGDNIYIGNISTGLNYGW